MSMGTEVAPLLLIVSGPSGSGKSTLVQKILELPGTMPSISCTTRARRATEASGKCYDFVSEAEFDTMVARGEFLEFADDEIARRLAKARDEIEAFGKYYDFCVVNEDVERAGREAQAIVTALRCTSVRRRDRVEKLLASFGGKD
jgi:guanylate kinase